MSINKYKLDKKSNIPISSFAILVGLIMTIGIQFLLETPYYSSARIILYGTFFLGGVFQLPYVKLKKNFFFTTYLILMFLAFFNELLIFLLIGTNSLNLVTHVALSFFLLFLGYNITISNRQKSQILVIYVVFTTILGLFIIFFYGNGFSIVQQYFFESKNQVGPFISNACLISLFALLMNQEKDTLLSNKLFLSIIFFVNFATLLSIRNRSGLVSLIVCLMVYLLSKVKLTMKIKSIVMFPIALIIFGGVLYSGIINPAISYVYDSLFLNYDVTDINSLSANRIGTYGQALEFIKESPFFGELSSSSQVGIPHNYVLNILLRYGIFGMLPLLVLYFYIGGFTLKKILLEKEDDISLYLILFVFVVSLFEYTYPYSPLTTVSMSWFLLGYYLNPTHEKESNYLISK